MVLYKLEDAAVLQNLQNEYANLIKTGVLFNYSQIIIPTNHHPSSTTRLPPPKKQQRREVLEYSNNTTATVVVLILSARHHFEARQAIRETWCSRHHHHQACYFVVGGLDPPHSARTIQYTNVTLSYQADDTLSLQALLKQAVQPKSVPGQEQQFKKDDPVVVLSQKVLQKFANGTLVVTVKYSVVEWIQEPPYVQRQLVKEAQTHGDVLDAIHPDKYTGGLAYKLRFGLQWITRHHVPQAEWIVKADDDMYVRVEALQRSVLNWYNGTQLPFVIGHIRHKGRVARSFGHAWKEFLYPYQYYPPFPVGSYGYVVSRPVAEFVAHISDSQITYYQGEDTSLGIWLDQSRSRGGSSGNHHQRNRTVHNANSESWSSAAPVPPLLQHPVVWIKADAYFTNRGGASCASSSSSSSSNSSPHPWIIQGHGLSPRQLRQCHQIQFPSQEQQQQQEPGTRSTSEIDRDRKNNQVKDDEWSGAWVYRALSRTIQQMGGENDHSKNAVPSRTNNNNNNKNGVIQTFSGMVLPS
ncbi:hypothetical protein ACA910_021250 [Epithemia clementina (nom. ined.)]